MTAMTILIIACAYLVGSVSSAIIVCRLFGKDDPRTQGSHNPGATNVLRIAGKLPAALVLVFDILKGTVSVWGAYFLGLNPIELGLVAVAVCLGHIFPVFFGFSGGKAVATAFGALLPIGLDLSLMLIVIWLIVLFCSGYSSLAAVITVSLAPFITWFVKAAYALPVAMLAVLIIVRHKDNLIRLVKGQEPKIRQKYS
ncbi:glycerol-3-phosphate 1-O-acyltransferase PlsY [Paraglaciecola hydrolytica]|uniref:Glycerol-3-phosphate acyltransferase n=1 Tax=Paraglaciecola hydrolytica TaxID=1799789 RepID=A0A136A064_9ALTE|nr:glycerol-3-phosphate 1-O-acyltransferase PlsY [Paraglaciecola hydrolytica]KXI28604.1 glycerol-3-phosphate acyltransferase [Paraglaciecola hydrolytica]